VEEAEGGTRVHDEVAGDGRENPYPGLADHVDVEGEVVGGQSDWGWASGQTVRLVGFHLVFPSMESS
jgi:hypothetical protein